MSYKNNLKAPSIHALIDGVDNKKCKKCLQFKPATPSNFYRWKHGADGFADWCKSCRQGHDKKVYPTTKVRFDQWRKANMDTWHANMKNVKARRRMQIGEGKITKQEWQDRLAEFNHHCAYCLEPFDDLQQEHMHPLSRGGSHSIDNVIPACGKCNNTKNDKSILEIARLFTTFVPDQEALQPNHHA